MGKQPSDSVRIVLRDRLKPEQFLVLSESDDPDNFKLCGGKFEPGEKPHEAAIRELKEELTLEVGAAALGSVVELLNDDGISKRYIFDLEVNPDDLIPTDEIHTTMWATKETVPAGKNQGHILAAVQAADNLRQESSSE